MTAPDSRAPPTVAEEDVIAIGSVGSVEAPAAELTAIVPASASRALAVMARNRISRFIEWASRLVAAGAAKITHSGDAKDSNDLPPRSKACLAGRALSG